MISIFFTFSSLSDPQALDKGQIVQFLVTKPQISQKQDFSGGVRHILSNAQSDFDEKKSGSKKIIVLLKLRSDRRNLRDFAY